jgi:hypothetical protein
MNQEDSMHLNFRRALRLLCIPAAAFGFALLAAGEAPPHFAGSYQLTSVVVDGSQVHFTLKFTLLNPNDADVKSGILVLMDSQPNGLMIGEIATIASLTHLGQTSVVKSFTVSTTEYARWREGHQPRFDFLVPATGGAIDVHVQARPVAQPVQTTK